MNLESYAVENFVNIIVVNAVRRVIGVRMILNPRYNPSLSYPYPSSVDPLSQALRS